MWSRPTPRTGTGKEVSKPFINTCEWDTSIHNKFGPYTHTVTWFVSRDRRSSNVRFYSLSFIDIICSFNILYNLLSYRYSLFLFRTISSTQYPFPTPHLFLLTRKFVLPVLSGVTLPPKTHFFNRYVCGPPLKDTPLLDTGFWYSCPLRTTQGPWCSFSRTDFPSLLLPLLILFSLLLFVGFPPHP